MQESGVWGIGADGWTAIFTGVLAVFTAVLTFVSLFQINFLKRADQTARISADAARKAAEVAERSLTSLERPFIAVDGHAMEQLVPEIKGSDFLFSTIWKNYGRTATVRGFNYINWTLLPGPIQDDFDFSDRDFKIDDLVPITIAPGATSIGNRLELPYGYVKDAIEGRGYLYVWGWFEYSGIFAESPRFRTEFCIRIRSDYYGPPGADGKRKTAITFPRPKQFNGVDGECRNPIQT